MNLQTPANMRAGDAAPATVSGAEIKIEPRPAIPQRSDYVAPVPKFMDYIEVDTNRLLAIHRFLEINAIHPEHKDLAQCLRETIEG